MSTRLIIDSLIRKVVPLDSSIPAVYRPYYRSRDIWPKYLCHAPFNNMYFNSVGDIANCWLTFDDPEKYDGTRSIREIWFGEKYSRLRQAIREYDLDFKCKTCKHHLEVGNHVNVLARAYDNHFPIVEYPTMMEFELSNTCNLECTMCTGLLSSAIRKNREGLPALKSPYGDRFVEDLREFIPHLREARFNGGEPFLIHIYYKMWDLIHEINPSLKIVVATNGTTLTERVKKYLERGNFHLNISIDSLDEKTYSEVRINGNLSQVLVNFEYFKEYCKKRGSNLCIMVNPMRQNWHEMGNFVDFCNRHGVHVWFNTIVRPYDQALWNLSSAELNDIHKKLSAFIPQKRSAVKVGLYKYNTGIFHNFVQRQVKVWYEEALVRENQNAVIEVPENTVSPREHFMGQLNVFLSSQFNQHPEEAMTASKSLQEKILAMEKYVEGKVSLDTFYTFMNSNNIATVVLFLLENPQEKIEENINRYVFQQS